jgi:hypothetical protein
MESVKNYTFKCNRISRGLLKKLSSCYSGVTISDLINDSIVIFLQNNVDEILHKYNNEDQQRLLDLIDQYKKTDLSKGE